MLPDTLKHYTSIDTLEKILESKKIRFNRFDRMDDQTETEGLPNLLKKNYFLSCWCDEKRESIPQWEIYGKEGIRIEFMRKWYIKHSLTLRDNSGNIFIVPSLEDNPIGKIPLFILPYDEHLRTNKNYHVVTPLNEEEGLIVKVEYLESFSQTKLMYINESAEGQLVTMEDLFYPIIFKDTYWSFQNEYRYYLIIAPFGKEKAIIPEYIDVPINYEALNKIKVVLYPKCTEKDKKRVENILRKHLPNINYNNQIQRSQLDGKLR